MPWPALQPDHFVFLHTLKQMAASFGSTAGHPQDFMRCPEAEMIMCGGDGHLWASVVLMWSFLLSFQWTQRKNRRRKERDGCGFCRYCAFCSQESYQHSYSVVHVALQLWRYTVQLYCRSFRNCKEQQFVWEFKIKLYFELSL